MLEAVGEVFPEAKYQRCTVHFYCNMKLKEAAKKVEDGMEETLTYCDFPSEHWTRIRTNNCLERLSREIRSRYARSSGIGARSENHCTGVVLLFSSPNEFCPCQ